MIKKLKEVEPKQEEKPMTPHEKDEAARMKVMVDKAKENDTLANQGNKFGN